MKSSDSLGATVDGRISRGIDTRAKLIHGAAKEFASTGFDGASVRQIAKSAGVGFQLVAYYFGSKEELWLAVVESLFERAHEQWKRLQSLNLSLEALVRALLENSINEPHLRRLSVHEYLNGAERYQAVLLPRIKRLGAAFQALLAKYPDLSGRGVLTPVEAQLLINGFTHLNSVAPYEVSFFVGRSQQDPLYIDLQCELFLSLLIQGKGPREARTGGPLMSAKGALPLKPMPAHPVSPQYTAAAPHRLLAAATDMFAQRGYHSASLRDIAQASGVAYQLIRYHFGSKAELWAATLVYLLDQRFEAVNASRFDPAGDLSKQLEEWLRRGIYFSVVDNRMRRILTREYFSNCDHFMQTIRPRLDEWFSLLKMAYEEMLAAGAARNLDVWQFPLLLFSLGMVNGLQPDSVELITGIRTSNPRSIDLHVALEMKLLGAVSIPNRVKPRRGR